jgi:hypothetical protein
MNEETQQYIEHEVRLRVQEQNSIDLRNDMKQFKDDVMNSVRHLDLKLDSQFKWTIGIMITMFGGLIITKLI